jgi:hypothetical protein
MKNIAYMRDNKKHFEARKWALLIHAPSPSASPLRYLRIRIFRPNKVGPMDLWMHAFSYVIR